LRHSRQRHHAGQRGNQRESTCCPGFSYCLHGCAQRSRSYFRALFHVLARSAHCASWINRRICYGRTLVRHGCSPNQIHWRYNRTLQPNIAAEWTDELAKLHGNASRHQ
jgi:hypothetical protein